MQGTILKSWNYMRFHGNLPITWKLAYYIDLNCHVGVNVNWVKALTLTRQLRGGNIKINIFIVAFIQSVDKPVGRASGWTTDCINAYAA
jgi:hypothetical protein